MRDCVIGQGTEVSTKLTSLSSEFKRFTVKKVQLGQLDSNPQAYNTVCDTCDFR